MPFGCSYRRKARHSRGGIITQTLVEVLVLKIGDTASDKDTSIACGAPHASPRIAEWEHVQ